MKGKYEGEGGRKEECEGEDEAWMWRRRANIKHR